MIGMAYADGLVPRGASSRFTECQESPTTRGLPMAPHDWQTKLCENGATAGRAADDASKRAAAATSL